MSNEIGIQNTLEVIELGIALGGAFRSAKADDGSISAADIAHLIAVVPKVSPAVSGIGEIPAELKDLDDAEVEQIIGHVQELVGTVSSEKAVAIAEDAIRAAIAIYGIITKLRD